jgi:NAD(P)H-hydrate epimerase
MAETIGITPSADITVTFTSPKPANVLPPASRLNGELVIANIGTPIELVDEADSRLYLIEPRDAAAWLAATEFSPDSHKNQRGHALLIAGSTEYSGAAVLCGDAALRSGAGLVTLAVPVSSRDSIAARVSPEVMVRALAETEKGAVSAEAFNEIDQFIGEKADAVAIGCGLTSDDESTRRLVREIVERRRTPVIIDADGLNALAPFDLTGSEEMPLVLTPHIGEFRRLTGRDHRDDDLVAAAAEFASRHHVYLILKGERPLIAEPKGRVAVCPTGNSGLGKAGNGDTLTGVIAGFVAQAMRMNIGLCQTIVAAVYLAGTAGDIAERRFGKRVMIASDVRDCLHDAFLSVCEQA